MAHLHPIPLLPYYRSTVWGGGKLRSPNMSTANDKIGEAWLLSVREKENCLSAQTHEPLRDILQSAPTAMIGSAWDGKDFPLLVKYIDAAAPLSVQVHPDDAYAAQHGGRGKTEMWVILEAVPHAELVLGLMPGVTKETFARAIAAGKTESLLQRVPVKAGDVFFIPAGLVHAIGAGILLCEIQQNCDTTYRIFDYGRLGLDGKPRPLHIRQALDVIVPYTPEEIRALQWQKNPPKQTIPRHEGHPESAAGRFTNPPENRREVRYGNSPRGKLERFAEGKFANSSANGFENPSESGFENSSASSAKNAAENRLAIPCAGSLENPLHASQTLAACQYFSVIRHVVDCGRKLTITPESFHLFVPLSGAGTANGLPLCAGACHSLFLPAGMGEITLEGNLTLLDISL